MTEILWFENIPAITPTYKFSQGVNFKNGQLYSAIVCGSSSIGGKRMRHCGKDQYAKPTRSQKRGKVLKAPSLKFFTLYVYKDTRKHTHVYVKGSDTGNKIWLHP